MSGDGRRLTRDAFHHVAIAADGVDVVVEELVTWPVELRCLPPFGNRHSHAVCHALPQRASGGFYSGDEAVFGMAGSFAVELAEALDIVQRDGKLAQSFI